MKPTDLRKFPQPVKLSVRYESLYGYSSGHIVGWFGARVHGLMKVQLSPTLTVRISLHGLTPTS